MRKMHAHWAFTGRNTHS